MEKITRRQVVVPASMAPLFYADRTGSRETESLVEEETANRAIFAARDHESLWRPSSSFFGRNVRKRRKREKDWRPRHRRSVKVRGPRREVGWIFINFKDHALSLSLCLSSSPLSLPRSSERKHRASRARMKEGRRNAVRGSQLASVPYEANSSVLRNTDTRQSHLEWLGTHIYTYAYIWYTKREVTRFRDIDKLTIARVIFPHRRWNINYRATQGCYFFWIVRVFRIDFLLLNRAGKILPEYCTCT